MIDAPIDAVVTPPAPIILEAEAYARVSAGTHTWTTKTDVPMFSGTGFVELLPHNGFPCVPTTTTCAEMQYDVMIPAAGTYYFHARMWAPNGSTSDDSVFVGLDSTLDAVGLDVVANASWQWGTNAATFEVTRPGAHVLRIVHREGGARVDRLAFLTSATPPP